MKVFHIITGLNDGGAEAVLYRLCQSDLNNSHTVISLMDHGKYGSLLSDLGVAVHTLNFSSGRLKISGLIDLYNLIKKNNPDVVQTWMYHADLIGGVIARFAGIRNIVWGVHHTTLVQGESSFSTIVVAKLNAVLSRIVPQKIIYCAQKSRDVQESIGFINSKGVVIRNGYNIRDYKPNDNARSAFRKALGISDETFLIGHVGRFDPQKDYDNLIRSISKIKKQNVNYVVVLVGSNLSSSNKPLLRMINEHNLKEKFTLLGRRNDIPDVMNGIDLFVLSSAFGEAFPNVLNEAMACGTPCVTTGVGDASVIVGQTGWVVSSKNPKQLAAAIDCALCEFKQDRLVWVQRKIDARYRIVNNFSIEKMVTAYNNVWKKKSF